MKPAAAYYRMSSDQQEASIPAQREAVRKWAKANCWHLVTEYLDEAISGDATDKRLGFQRLVKDAAAGKFQAVIVWNLSRLGRFDSLEAGFWLHPLRKSGVQILTLDKGQLDWNDFAGRIVWGIEQEMSHSYLVNLARDSLRGKIQGAKAGQRQGGTAPYGYRLENRKLVVDQATAPIVRQIFADYLAGNSIRAIAERLNERGLKTSRGGIFRSSTVLVILRNPVYLGVTAWNQRRSGTYCQAEGGDVKTVKGKPAGTPRAAHEADWIVTPGTHEPIVEQGVWDATQGQLAARKTYTTPKRNGGDFMLTGLVKCGYCGAGLVGSMHGGIAYLKCAGNQIGGRAVCLGRTVRQDVVIESVVTSIYRIFRDTIEKRVLEQVEQNAGSDRELADSLERQLATSVAEVERLKRRICEVASDMIPVVQDAYRRAVEAERTLRHQVESLKGKKRNRAQEVAEARKRLEALSVAAEIGPSPHLRNLLRQMVARVTVWIGYRQAGKLKRYSIERGTVDLRGDLSSQLDQHEPTSWTSSSIEFQPKTTKK